MDKPIDELVRIDESLAPETVAVYAKVFAGEPWYEDMKCASCDVAYGTPEDKERGYAAIETEDVCKNAKCAVNDPDSQEKLQLIPFYTGEDEYGLEIFNEAVSMDDFIGYIGKKDGNLIGFSWGFKVPTEIAETTTGNTNVLPGNTASVWFNQIPDDKLIKEGRVPIVELLKRYNINPESTFYAAETGVAEESRKGGVATTLSGARVKEARDIGYENIVFRTKNGALTKTFQKLFGKQGLTMLFEDPNPAKESTMWYLMRTADLR